MNKKDNASGPVILLDETKIGSVLKQLALSRASLSSSKPSSRVSSPGSRLQIQLFDVIDSTNTYLKSNHLDTLAVCLAEQQTQGRGRFHRGWYSPYGQNIYLSLAYHFEKTMNALAGLSLVTSLSVYDTLCDFGVGKKLHVKWPNDVFYDDKKLAGSLIEMQSIGSVSRVIIGIGLNVNMTEADATVAQPWTSMRNILHTSLDRNIVSAHLIHDLVRNLELYNQLGFSPFIQPWLQSDCLYHQTVTIRNEHTSVTGYVTGINEQGHLLLKLENGDIHAFSAGDTSILK